MGFDLGESDELVRKQLPQIHNLRVPWPQNVRALQGAAKISRRRRGHPRRGAESSCDAAMCVQAADQGCANALRRVDTRRAHHHARFVVPFSSELCDHRVMWHHLPRFFHLLLLTSTALSCAGPPAPALPTQQFDDVSRALERLRRSHTWPQPEGANAKELCSAVYGALYARVLDPPKPITVSQNDRG